MTIISPKEKRKAIYTIIENIIGRPLLMEERERVKIAVLAYAQEEHLLRETVQKSMEKQGLKINYLTRIVYKKGADAEILEKDLKFLKELFEREVMSEM